MDYCYLITEEQLALFLDAVKSLPIPVNEVPPPIIEEVLTPSTSKNPTILAMNQALIVEVIKLNASNEEEVKQRAEAAARKAEEATNAAVENMDKEDEHTTDVNSNGENEVDQDNMLKSKSKLKLKRKKLHPIVESESEEKTEEVKVKRGKAKGKGKAVGTGYKRNMVPVNYVGCPGAPVHEVDFIMLEATNDEELQAKLKKLCDEQDSFQKQKDKEKAERNKGTGNNAKVGSNVKASGSTLKSTTVWGSLRSSKNWAAEDEGEPADGEVFSQPEENLVRNLNIVSSPMVEETEDKEDKAEKVHEDVEEVREEVVGPHEEGREGHEVEDDETMKDPEGNEL
ncbi:hypothetical protein M422DRAFT_264005 [Sphaerobolus stellatus SS14]|uniref:Uncharacterized protein n=1 Tax=Sphaerobolus stellatus (strain SS14) TaxID=990650 RepID=A0A0C9V9R9_SPHS4|nr:hypothetical protein M422DRAFT_264005 [Sphaerobolus stellatus SS14]